jgi:separase
MIEVVHNKLLGTTSEDLNWPMVDGMLSSVKSQRAMPARASSPSPFSANEDVDDESVDEQPFADYWTSVHKKYTNKPFTLSELSRSRVDMLPENWTVVHISITDDKNTLFISRQRATQPPLVFCLPLKGRRESEEDEHLAFQDVLDEMKEIVRLNDETTRQAIHVKDKDKDARAAWWAERMELDKRLQELLENIEFCWLGAFKVSLFMTLTAFQEI